MPTGTSFNGTTVGGLSSITYDASRNVYYVLSDDQSQINPARFYTVSVDVGPSFDASDVHFDAVTTLQEPGAARTHPGVSTPRVSR